MLLSGAGSRNRSRSRSTTLVASTHLVMSCKIPVLVLLRAAFLTCPLHLPELVKKYKLLQVRGVSRGSPGHQGCDLHHLWTAAGELQGPRQNTSRSKVSLFNIQRGREEMCGVWFALFLIGKKVVGDAIKSQSFVSGPFYSGSGPVYFGSGTIYFGSGPFYYGSGPFYSGSDRFDI